MKKKKKKEEKIKESKALLCCAVLCSCVRVCVCVCVWTHLAAVAFPDSVSVIPGTLLTDLTFDVSFNPTNDVLTIEFDDSTPLAGLPQGSIVQVQVRVVDGFQTRA